MIKEKKRQSRGPIEIDLSGPDGNAYVLLGYASRFAQQLGIDFDSIREEMTSSDYENLIQVMDKYFGDYIILYRA